MGLLSNIAQGIRSLFHRDRIERDMDDELRGFVEASTADKLRAWHTRGRSRSRRPR